MSIFPKLLLNCQDERERERERSEGVRESVGVLGRKVLMGDRVSEAQTSA